MPDSQADDLVAVPLFAQFPKRAALALCDFNRAAHTQGILALVEQYTGFPRLDAGLCRGHGGVVAEGQPVLTPGEAIAQSPRGAIASLLAQIQPVAVTEQHPLARSMSALPPAPPSARLRSVALDWVICEVFRHSQAALIVEYEPRT